MSRLSERGQALIEFAILMPFLVILCLGTVDLARVYLVTEHLKNAAREGAYLAAVSPLHQYDDGSGNCSGPADIWDRVVNEAGGSASSLTMTVKVGATAYSSGPTFPGGLVCSTAVAPGLGTSVTVTVTDNTFGFITPLVQSLTGISKVSSSVTVTEEQ